MKWRLELIGWSMLCIIAIGGGLSIIFTGKIGTGFGHGYYAFDGLERFMGFIPMGIGILFLYGIYEKWKQERE